MYEGQQRGQSSTDDEVNIISSQNWPVDLGDRHIKNDNKENHLGRVGKHSLVEESRVGIAWHTVN